MSPDRSSGGRVAVGGASRPRDNGPTLAIPGTVTSYHLTFGGLTPRARLGAPGLVGTFWTVRITCWPMRRYPRIQRIRQEVPAQNGSTITGQCGGGGTLSIWTLGRE